MSILLFKRNLILAAFLALFSLSCQKNKQAEEAQEYVVFDSNAELNSIKETKTAFQRRVKDHRFEYLKIYAPENTNSLTPDYEPWMPFKK